MTDLSEQRLRDAADALARAERTATPIAPLSERWPELTAEGAYAIQQHNIQRRVEAGAEVRGHKVGLLPAPCKR